MLKRHNTHATLESARGHTGRCKMMWRKKAGDGRKKHRRCHAVTPVAVLVCILMIYLFLLFDVSLSVNILILRELMVGSLLKL